MNTSRLLLALLLAPFTASAALGQGDLPQGTLWYLHADLAGMRDSASGRQLNRWLDGEIFVELKDETGIDVNEEVDRVTAYSSSDNGLVVVLQGPVKTATRDKLLAMVALESSYEVREHRNLTYYHAGDLHKHRDDADRRVGFGDAAFFSFALPGKLLVTSHEAQMQELLANDGRITGGGEHNGALLVLSADKSFVQAGLRADKFADSGGGWDSNILRNTEQAALLIADQRGLLAIEAQLKSTDPRMAESIGSVVNGLISLQAFNSELDPEIRTLIENTRVRALDAVLTISTVLDPAVLMRVLD